MIWLVIGVVVWSGVHLSPSLAQGVRTRLIDHLGRQKYRGVFALAILASIVLMVIGWRATTPVLVYVPPGWGHAAGAVLVLIAFILFASSHGKNNIKHIIRHPQLTGVIVWAVGHLLANGDTRSLVLFGGLSLWAIAEMFFIDQRERTWQRPHAQPLTADIRPIIGGLIIYLVLFLAHPYLFGVSPSPAYDRL